MTESEKSLDAIIAMVEANLPELDWCVKKFDATGGPYCARLSRYEMEIEFEFGATPALALMNAYQAAMAEKEKST